MKHIDYLYLGYGLYIKDDELKEGLCESDESLDDVLSWEDGWNYVIKTLEKLLPYDNN